ncbi:MAG TPA: hypothetical protein VFH12_05260 [Pseudoxanthomonas sp.]|nr:hypothetical protein [Pseudoxanthomonas sp.]
MSIINKVPAGAGAEWLLGGFKLLWRSPATMAAVSVAGLFVVMMAVVVAFAVVAATASFPFPLSLIPLAIYCALTLGVPCLVFAGVIWAAREVALGKPARVQHLQAGLGHVRALLVTSVVPMAGLFLSSLLLIALLGNEGVQHVNEVLMKLQALFANGAQPNPTEVEALIATLPMFRFLFWMLLTLLTTPFVVCVLMLAVSDVVFSGRSGFSALRLSIAANFKNFTAMIVFSLLLTALLFGISAAAQLVGLTVQFVLGPVAAILVINLLLAAVLMPVLAGAAYTAWQQVLAGNEGESSHVASQASTHIEA